MVPKLAIAIQQRVSQRLAAGGIRERLASLVVQNDVAKSLRTATGQRNVPGDVLHWLLGPLQQRIARRIRGEIVGPEFDYFISGGAKLPLETAAFLMAIGLPIYEGYGSTETNCPIASNTPRQFRLGSVGKLFPEIEVKIDPVTGELLVKGPNVASGYLHDGDESSTWDGEGWYHTRDAAALDDDGFLRIEGRLDNMMVLLNGENVSPVAIENYCLTIPGVDSAMVVGDHRPALVALLAINEEAAQEWADDAGHRLTADWRRDPALLAWLRSEVEQKVNHRAGHPYECIRNFAVIEPPSIDRQTLTATEKVRRKELEKRHAGLIDELYAHTDEWLSPDEPAPVSMRRVAAL